MTARLFGFEFKRVQEKELPSFVPREFDDGAAIVAAAGAYGTFIDLEGSVRSESELITRYREMALHPEVDMAIEEIVGEAVTKDETDDVVHIVLDNCKTLSASLKKRVEEEFESVLELLEFNVKFHDMFRRWYIDGRLTFHAVIDPQNTKEGIKELRYIDPRKIKKVREVLKRRLSDQGIPDAVVKTKNEYYLYNDRGFGMQLRSAFPQTTGIKIAKDAVLQITSNVTDATGQQILSFLHQAIKPLNQLRTLEDATVIYRIARAPERRVWYIDVGQLPKMKAEQYMKDLMTKHKNRLVYDASTGDIKDDRRWQTMLEDFWLPQREGKGTKVETLREGNLANQLDDVQYFLKKLFNALKVPVGRLDQENSTFMGNQSTQITREELKFGKFIDRLRTRFSDLFLKGLEKQLVLKQIITIEEWDQIKNQIRFNFVKDSYFTELKDKEIMQFRFNMLPLVDPYVGRYVSNHYVRTKILLQGEKDMEEEDKLIAEEAENQQFMPYDLKMAQAQMDMQMDAQGQQADQEQQQQIDQAGGPQEHDQNVQAQSDYESLKDKKGRSMADESKYKKSQLRLSRQGLIGSK